MGIPGGYRRSSLQWGLQPGRIRMGFVEVVEGEASAHQTIPGSGGAFAEGAADLAALQGASGLDVGGQITDCP